VLAVVCAIVVAACGAGSGHRSTATQATTTSTTVASKSRYLVRGIYDRDFSPTGFNDEVALGFNYIDSGPYLGEMRTLAAHHLKGLVWLGGYDNKTCRFHDSDAWVRSHVSAIAGNPGVGAYFIDDEPNAAACPTAPAQIRARSALVKSIDPGPPTLLVQYRVDELHLFAGTADVIGLDHYPCSRQHGCNYSIIDQEAAVADKLGIRYWGVIQAHGDSYYSVPTPQQLHEEFMHWRATRMQGYLVFAWHWPSGNSSLWLANNHSLQGQLARENAQ
jgi:hypothetical protein